MRVGTSRVEPSAVLRIVRERHRPEVAEVSQHPLRAIPYARALGDSLAAVAAPIMKGRARLEKARALPGLVIVHEELVASVLPCRACVDVVIPVGNQWQRYDVRLRRDLPPRLVITNSAQGAARRVGGAVLAERIVLSVVAADPGPVDCRRR